MRLGKNCHIPESRRGERKARCMKTRSLFTHTSVEADLLVVRNRVDQLESNHLEILALLKQGARAETPTAATTSLNPPPSAANNQLQGVDLVSPAKLPPSLSRTTVIGGVSLEEFETSLKCYRRMSETHFPFVLIPESCNALSLCRERPMLARAIAIVTSWRSPERQSVLRTYFLKDLAEKYFIKSERSLDLLQAVLVYYVW